MAKQCSLPVNELREWKADESVADFFGSPTAFAIPIHGSSGVELGSPVKKPTCLHIKLEELKCFEVVERQFQNQGIILKNAIALQPSNPAFPSRTGNIVLMGAPRNGFLEVIFQHPAQFFSAYVTSSQRTILSAYDHKDNLLARTEMAGPNLATGDYDISANTKLSLNTPNICRVTFYAFDGQLTVDDLSFAF